MSTICARFDARAKHAFITYLAAGGNAAAAARAVGVGYSTVQAHRKSDAAFAADWEEAIALCAGTLEHAVMQRAVQGIKKRLWHQGEPVIDPATGEQAFDVVFSDSREQFLLKGMMPDKYRERSSVDVSSAGDLSKLDREALMRKVEAAFAAAAKRRDGVGGGADIEDAVILSETINDYL